MINLRPSFGNRSRSVDDAGTRAAIGAFIARAREVGVDFLAGSNDYGSTAASLQKYFDQFALAARRRHLPA